MLHCAQHASSTVEETSVLDTGGRGGEGGEREGCFHSWHWVSIVWCNTKASMMEQ